MCDKTMKKNCEILQDERDVASSINYQIQIQLIDPPIITTTIGERAVTQSLLVSIPVPLQIQQHQRCGYARARAGRETRIDARLTHSNLVSIDRGPSMPFTAHMHARARVQCTAVHCREPRTFGATRAKARPMRMQLLTRDL